jgi:ParB family transcriptional regulator, chromosome partitioning protein
MTTAVKDVPITKIRVERNPRTRFDEESLAELAQSIKGRGLHQPIILEPGKKGTFVLVSGERRLRAHKQLGKTTIQAIIRARSNHNGRERFVDAIIENDQRADMNPIELGQAYRVLREEYQMTVREISEKIGKRETHIFNLLLLTDLDKEIQDMIEQGFYKDIRLARGLLKIEDSQVRIGLANRLFTQKVQLKGCLNAVERTLQAMVSTSKGKAVDFKRGTPALKMADVDGTHEPMRWDMLRQLGRVPAWPLVVHTAEQTCRECSLRNIASISTCRDCPAVEMLRKMVEAGQ